MNTRTYFKPSNKTIDTLIEELNLPEKLVSPKEIVLGKILEMKNQAYSTILIERYLNGRTFSKIEELHPEIYYAHIRSACETAVGNLRNDLLEGYEGMDPFPLGKYMVTIKPYARGYLSKSVKEIVEHIKSLDYKPNKDYDRIIKTLEEHDYQLNYPKFLLRHPDYPYNLYSHIIQGNGIHPSMTAKEIRSRYMKDMIYHPSHNLNVFLMNVDKIFHEDNTLLTQRQKDFVYHFYKKKMRIPDIAKSLGVSESLIKLELRRVIRTFNTDEGREFIYDIS